MIRSPTQNFQIAFSFCIEIQIEQDFEIRPGRVANRLQMFSQTIQNLFLDI